MALEKHRAYRGSGTAPPCRAPKIQKTRSPMDPRGPRLGLQVHRRAWGAQGRPCSGSSTALWGRGSGQRKGPRAGGTRVQMEGRVPGAVRLEARRGTFLGVQLQKARWRVLRSAGVRRAGMAQHSGCSRGWNPASPGVLGWIWSCSQPRFWRGSVRGAHQPTKTHQTSSWQDSSPRRGAATAMGPREVASEDAGAA